MAATNQEVTSVFVVVMEVVVVVVVLCRSLFVRHACKSLSHCDHETLIVFFLR